MKDSKLPKDDRIKETVSFLWWPNATQYLVFFNAWTQNSCTCTKSTVMFIPRNLKWLLDTYNVFLCLGSIQFLLFQKVVFSNCHDSKVAIETSSLLGMNKWREDAFFHWKLCKFLTYERTYLPVFCFLCVLHVPFLRGKTSNEKQNRDEWTFLYEYCLAMQRNRTVKRVTSRNVYMHFTI